MIIFAKTVSVMPAGRRIQTVLRLPEDVYERVKLCARRENCSINAYLEALIERSTGFEWPKIPKDFKISDEILALVPKSGHHRMFTKEELDADPKLAYLAKKNGLV